MRAEKEKFGQWKDQLEREKNEAFRQLKRQAAESEATRRGLERARQEVVRQVTAIAAEKENLEKENEKLKEALSEERKGVGHYLVDLTQQKKRISQNIIGLEKEVSELKFIARQSASLNNQFKKGMKHLTMCKRKKCSVCVYTKSTFGDYADRSSDTAQLLSCFQAPLQDLRNWIRPQSRRASAYSSEETQTSASSPSPSPSLPLDLTREVALGAGGGLTIPPYISYIDEVSTSSSSESSSEDS
ncbi:hypothetical protein L9F63_021075, partial [Diploptera punctata]